MLISVDYFQCVAFGFWFCSMWPQCLASSAAEERRKFVWTPGEGLCPLTVLASAGPTASDEQTHRSVAGLISTSSVHVWGWNHQSIKCGRESVPKNYHS